MTKLIPIEENGVTVGYWFDCPGCQRRHAPYVRPCKNSKGAGWEFNNSLEMESPTFSPSILVRYELNGKEVVYHSFVREGKIEFLSDCTHSLAGKTVELPDAAIES